MIGCGVPAGASMPNHSTDSQSGTPASTMVGRSGKKTLRLASVTASGTSLPVGKWPDTDRGRREIAVDAAAQQVGDDLRAAGVGDVRDFDVGERLEQLERQMRRAADAGRAER